MASNLPRQIIAAGLQSGSIMFCADAFTQTFLEGRRISKNDVSARKKDCYDVERSMRWGLAGLVIHGPYFFVSFRAMEAFLQKRLVTQSQAAMVAAKTTVAQFAVFPAYLVAIFSYMGLAEGLTLPEIQTKVHQRVPEAFIGGCAFWPAVNIINFWIVPAAFRVPYLAGVGSIWNVFLSWLNAQPGSPQNTTPKS
eukprot:scaffold42964_cov47-Attheya_sp.AAC.2